MLLIVNEKDFVLASFPRSGNTWLRFILASLMTKNHKEITFHNYHEFIPDIHVIKNNDEWVSHLPFPRIIKSHFLPKVEYKNVIYIVRDPREVMLSYWHFEGKPCDFEDFIALDNIWPATWRQHIKQWIEHSKSNNVYFVKYEDILLNPLEEIKKILEYLRVQGIEDEFILQSIKNSNFSNMKKTEKEKGFWRHLKGESFVRSGKTDSWKKELSESSINKIVKQNYVMMKYLKYI